MESRSVPGAVADSSACRVLNMDFPDEKAWRAELEARGELTGDAGSTIAELAGQFGVPRRTMQRIVARGVAGGRYIRGVGIRVDSRGSRQKIPAYRLAKSRKKRSI